MNNIFLNISGDLVNINITFKWHVYIAENNQSNNQNIPILHWNIITNITSAIYFFFKFIFYTKLNSSHTCTCMLQNKLLFYYIVWYIYPTQQLYLNTYVCMHVM